MILCNAIALGEGVPDWVHLLPAGRAETVDGRGPFTFDAKDAAAVIEASLASSPDGKLVIDINHATDLAATRGEAAPAQGWIEEFQNRADGLWGRVAWTKAGQAALNGRAYRFLSLVILAAKATGKVAAVLRASLTNNPNLRGLTPVLNAANPETDMDFLKQLLAALGLESGDEQAVLTAVKTLKTETSAHAADLARIAKAAKAADGADLETVLNAVSALATPKDMVPAASVEALRVELNTAVGELKAIKDQTARDKATNFVDAMIAAGKPGVKPLRDHFISRHMADPAAVEKELNAQISLTATGTVKATPPADGNAVLDESELRVAQMLGVSPDDYKKTKAASGQEVH